MSIPFPVTVCGPITPLSPAVKVTGVLAAADVTIFESGSPIGYATAGSPGELWVGLTSQPKVGHKITASQKNADGISELSPRAIVVVDVPDPLPVPVICSDLNTCMVDIYAAALVPGATVITRIGGQPFGSSKPSQETSWLGIDPTKAIGHGSSAEVHQEATIKGVIRVSDTAQSLPIPTFSLQDDRLPPPLLGPLTECDTSRAFLQVVGGAALTIVNENQSESWINPSNSFNGYGAPPLKIGKAIAMQSMPRCNRQSEPVTLPVARAAQPPAPIVTQEVCPQMSRLTVSNLEPGGVLHVSRLVKTSPSVSTISLWGDFGIAYRQQQFDLPPSLALTDPAGPVSLLFSQSRCDGLSPSTEVKVATASGPFGAPQLIEPLFDCGRAIPITGAHPGAEATVIDSKTGLPISDPYGVAQADMVIPLWFPLVAGQYILVRQHGCHADGDSQVVEVKALPNPIPIPKIVEPLRPHAPWVKVTDVLPGARLHLLVNNQLRPGSVDVLSETGIITVQGAPLADQDRVFVIQTICNTSSQIEGRGVRVERGHLKVSVDRSQVARGTTVSVTVTAIDADTGTPVAAQVLLNGINVGTTGIPFSYSPHLGEPNPTGVVSEPAVYFDGTFSINLVDPSWTLFLQAGPVPAWLDKLKINIDEISWSVSPDWNAALVKTVAVTPSAPAATGSAILPIPTGAVKTVTVSISGKASTEGGYLDGWTIDPQNSTIVSDTKKVAFHGPNERIGWTLQVQYVSDQVSHIVFNVVPVFAGINDVP